MNIFNAVLFVIAVAIIELSSSVSAAVIPMGCYKDTSDRDLPKKVSDDMSPEDCFRESASLGFKYCGLQHGKQCWAGNAYGKHGALKEKDCNMVCKHDEKHKCGGSWKQSIFEIPENYQPAGAEQGNLEQGNSEGPGGEPYLGCYKDTSDRDIPHLIGKISSSFTVKQCFQEAKHRGYKYAALQNTLECWAGNDFGKYGKLDNKKCKNKCADGSPFKCGGGWKNSVYRMEPEPGTGSAPGAQTNSVEYKGCYKDTSDRDLPKKISDDMSREACFHQCALLGFKFCGLQYGAQCWAGNAYGKHGALKKKDCNMVCKHDKPHKCGGSWKQSIFEIPENYQPAGAVQGNSESDAGNASGMTGPTAYNKYIGCYKDNKIRDLEHVITMDISNIGGYEECFNRAMEQGYKYAGLQYGKECWAGNEFGFYGKASESDCHKKCKDQHDMECGGDWRNSIFALNLCNFDGIKYSGSVYEEGSTDDTPADCQQRCKESNDCEYFSLSGALDNGSGAGCYLSPVESVKETVLEVSVSGSKTCNTEVPEAQPICTGPTARWWGDPHMVTFDNLKYDCMGAGEFVVFKDMNSSFEVRGRFQYLYDSDKNEMKESGVTVTRAVSYNSGDGDIVTFVTRDETGDAGCSVERFRNGDYQKTYEPRENVEEMFANGSSIVIKTENVHKYGCYMSVLLCIDESISAIGGLLGNPTDSKTDDWMTPDLTRIEIPTHITLPVALEYCVENWCVKDEADSMFEGLYDNEGKNSFNYYNFCGSVDAASVAEIQELIDSASDEIKEQCNYSIDCITEAVIGGQEAVDAENAVNDEFNDYEDSYHAGGAKPESPTELPTTSPISPPTTSPTISPTTSATISVTGSAVYGDPHFKTWAGQKYDYHGICDLVLLSHPYFNGGLGMNIHVRAKKTKQWSYISTAVVRIGNEIFEVSGGKDGNTHLLNKTEVKKDEWDQKSVKIGDYLITYKKYYTNQHGYVINLGKNEFIEIKTWKDMVRVDIIVNHETNTFGGSLGLMGSYPEGIMLGRDGKTIISEYNKFGQEWQVQSSEPKMFHVIEGPQHPAKCEIPSKSVMRRRLAQSIVTRKEAEIACAKVGVDEFDLCVFDVMAIGDTNSAGAY